MKKLFFLLLISINTPVISQNAFSVQELINTYHSDKAKAIQSIQAKGYVTADIGDFRNIFGPEDEHAALYSRKVDASKVGFTFSDQKISTVILSDSVKNLNTLFQQLEKLNFELAKQHGDMARAYVKKKANYFVTYDIVDEAKSVAMVCVMLKTKRNRILYSSK
jgi:hypothetical protein